MKKFNLIVLVVVIIFFDSGLAFPQLLDEPIKVWNMYVGENSVWAAGYWRDKELFVNKDISHDTWEQIQLPLTDDMKLVGIIDGVDDNIIVLPGHFTVN